MDSPFIFDNWKIYQISDRSLKNILQHAHTLLAVEPWYQGTWWQILKVTKWLVLKCPRSLDPFYIVSYYIDWDKTTWTYNNSLFCFTMTAQSMIEHWNSLNCGEKDKISRKKSRDAKSRVKRVLNPLHDSFSVCPLYCVQSLCWTRCKKWTQDKASRKKVFFLVAGGGGPGH